MKVVAQSTVPSKPSYMHLGYLAAASGRPLFGIGLFIVLLGFIFLVRFKKTKKLAELTFRRPIVWSILGMVLITAGLGIVFFGPLPASARILAKRMVTVDTMKNIDAVIAKRLEAGQGMPDGLDVLLAENDLPEKSAMDGWGQSIKLEKSKSGDNVGHLLRSAGDDIGYLLRSAGDDGEFGTEDDWIYALGGDEKQSTLK